MTEPTEEQPAVTPAVSTAPARSRWSRIPHHLGRARTSTVVLAVLFLAIGTLYLNVRPDTTGTATTGTSNEVPAQVTDPVPVPTTTTTPEPTVEEPTPTVEPTVPGTPTGLSTPEETTGSTLPTPTGTSPEPTLPSVPTSPPG